MTAASTALVMLVLVLGGSGVSASFSPKVANFTKRTIVNSMNQPNVVGQAVQHLHSQHNKQAKLAQAHTHTRTQAHTHTRTRFSPRSLLNEHAQAHATLYAADAPGYTDPFYIFNVTSADHHGVSVLHPGCLVVHSACSLSHSHTLTHTHTHTHSLSLALFILSVLFCLCHQAGYAYGLLLANQTITNYFNLLNSLFPEKDLQVCLNSWLHIQKAVVSHMRLSASAHPAVLHTHTHTHTVTLTHSLTLTHSHSHIHTHSHTHTTVQIAA